VRVDDPEFGTFQLVRNGVNLSETPAEIRLRPPKLGEQNAEILRTLGYDATQIEALRERKII
jgi:crotonobetainyl-CoA:carnitine CoA-transferase CaiB-like acyl-CoA transferase